MRRSNQPTIPAYAHNRPPHRCLHRQERPFAQPILAHLRKTIHVARPDVVETTKWGMPSFTYHGILCGLAAFKQHCTFGFWQQEMQAPPNRTKRAKRPWATWAASPRQRSAVENGPHEADQSSGPAQRQRRESATHAEQESEIGRSAFQPIYRPPSVATNKPRPRSKTSASAIKREYVEWITGSKTRRNPHQASRPGHRMARRRQVTQLEIRTLVSLAPRSHREKGRGVRDFTHRRKMKRTFTPLACIFGLAVIAFFA